MIIKDGSSIDVEIISLVELLSLIKDINPDLYKALQDNPNAQKYKFYKARYKFGDPILSNGVLYFSKFGMNGSVAFNDKSMPDHMAHDLEYNAKTEDPLAVFLNNTSESYYYKAGVPLDPELLHPGSIIGIPRAINPINMRSSILARDLNAGCRSIFMLNRIGDAKLYSKIEKNDSAKIHVPNNSNEHYKTFVDIVNLKGNNWFCEVVYFSREFINDLNKPELATLNVCLNRIYTSKYNVKHNLANKWNILYFMDIEKENVLSKYNYLHLNVIKHLLFVSAKSDLALEPATNNDKIPLQVLSKFFREEYGVFNPVIMQPANFDYTDPLQKPVYLSMHYTKILMETLENKGKKTNLTVLSEIQYLHARYDRAIKEDKDLLDSILHDFADKIEIKYFHTRASELANRYIDRVDDILIDDIRFNCVDNSENLETLRGSHFFYGGIVLKKL